MRKVILGMLMGSLLVVALNNAVRAQSTTMNFQVATGTTAANCSVVAAATVYCLTGGGTIYVA